MLPSACGAPGGSGSGRRAARIAITRGRGAGADLDAHIMAEVEPMRLAL